MSAFSDGLSVTCNTWCCVPRGLCTSRSFRLTATTRVFAQVRYRPLLSGCGVGRASTTTITTMDLLFMREMYACKP